MSAGPLAAKDHIARRQTALLLTLFGSLYFIQGVIEPTAGLLSQPIQTQLEDWQLSAARIGQFLGFIAIPWSLKPLFGLLTDFCPILGSYRRSYLILSTALAAAFFVWLSGSWGQLNYLRPAGWLLLAVTAAVAMTDVVVDALSVEVGQPRQLTGELQSAQWGAMSVASILAGSLGGYVATNQLLRGAFLGCGVLALSSLVIIVSSVREPARPSRPSETLKLAWRELKSGPRLLSLASVAAFLFLWNFNPFSSAVLQNYSTRELHLSHQFYGNLLSIQAIAQVAACIAYGFLCRRIPFGWLIHGSILLGILSIVCFLPMRGSVSAVLASIAFGLTYQLAALIQLDLAARICPPASAGTVFALLMAISNTGMSLGIYLGGGWYDGLTAQLGGNRHAAFDALVLIGAAFTAACWLLVPLLRRAGVPWK